MQLSRMAQESQHVEHKLLVEVKIYRAFWLVQDETLGHVGI